MRTIGQWAARGLLVIALLVLAGIGLGPVSGTYRLATVLSGSMAPGMAVGSVSVLIPVDPADVGVGDVIPYQSPVDRQVITHRVVEVVEPGPHPVLRTQGDANPSPDPWEARLAGATAWRRVAVIPSAGNVIRMLRSGPVHHATVHLVPLLLLGAMLGAIWAPRSRARPRRRVSGRQA